MREIAAGGQRARQTIQSRGAFFAAAFGLFAFMQLGCQVANDHGDYEVRTKHHEILELADVKSEPWWDEQEIPEQRAKRGQKKRRPPTQSGSGDYDCEQIEERDRPVTDVIND